MVKFTVYDPEFRTPGLQQVVMVEFDDYHRPFLTELFQYKNVRVLFSLSHLILNPGKLKYSSITKSVFLRVAITVTLYKPIV